jgi:hypothetical protein
MSHNGVYHVAMPTTSRSDGTAKDMGDATHEQNSRIMATTIFRRIKCVISS